MMPAHQLPQVLDAGRIFTDDDAGELFDRIAVAAFTNAGNALVGFDGDDMAALVENRAAAGYMVVPHPCDFEFGKGGSGLRRQRRRESGRGEQR